jgi:hypothetical protein
VDRHGATSPQNWLAGVLKLSPGEAKRRVRSPRPTNRCRETASAYAEGVIEEVMPKLRAALDPLAAPRPGTDGEPDPRLPAQRRANAMAAARASPPPGRTSPPPPRLGHRIR